MSGKIWIFLNTCFDCWIFAQSTSRDLWCGMHSKWFVLSKTWHEWLICCAVRILVAPVSWLSSWRAWLEHPAQTSFYVLSVITGKGNIVDACRIWSWRVSCSLIPFETYWTFWKKTNRSTPSKHRQSYLRYYWLVNVWSQLTSSMTACFSWSHSAQIVWTGNSARDHGRHKPNIFGLIQMSKLIHLQVPELQRSEWISILLHCFNVCS